MSERREERIRLGGPVVPVMVHTAGPGPTVVVTANVHGDEVTGVAAVHALDRSLRDSGLRAGTVALYPCLNPRGLEGGMRRFGDGDLNRCFPGSARGGPSDRAAHAVWTDLIARDPDAAVDLHADSPAAIPYALVDRAVHKRGSERAALERAAEGLARASGFVWMREYVDADYRRYHLDRSLAGALLNHGIPSVTLEVGPRRVVMPQAVERMVDAVRSILVHTGLLDGEVLPSADEGPWRRSATPRAERAGLFVAGVPAGTVFEPGAVLGEVRGLDGTCRMVIRAPCSGIVVSWAEGAWVEAGGAVGTLAVED